MKVATPRQRAAIVHGWAFWDLTPEDDAAIRRFLETGQREDLPSDYRAVFDEVVR